MWKWGGTTGSRGAGILPPEWGDWFNHVTVCTGGRNGKWLASSSPPLYFFALSGLRVCNKENVQLCLPSVSSFTAWICPSIVPSVTVSLNLIPTHSLY